MSARLGRSARGDLSWLDDANCVGFPHQDVFISPTFWTSKPQSLRTMAALVACRSCLVKSECLSFVAPASSRFDGIAGGKVWRDGRHNPPPKPTNAEELDTDLLYRHTQKVITKERRNTL